LAHPTCPAAAGDVMDAGTVDSVQEEMYGAWAGEGVVGGKVPEDRHWAVAEAVSRSHVIGRSTGSQCPFPVAVRKRGLCLRARLRYWVLVLAAQTVAHSCRSRQWRGLVALNTRTMEYEMNCSVKMCLAAGVAGVEELDIARTLALGDSC